MSHKNLNPVNPSRPKRVAIVLSNPSAVNHHRLARPANTRINERSFKKGQS